MRIAFTERATADYRNLASSLNARADKQFDLLMKNIRHPSLHAKKYDEVRDVWQGRITKGYRFYFRIEGDVYLILAITKHPKR